MSKLYRAGRKILRLASPRSTEYRFAWKHFADCEKVLDVACGTGTFMAHAPSKCVGIDLNPANVEYCEAQGYTAQVGNALALPFPDGSFDGVHSSHVIQVFSPGDAHQYLSELFRVCRPGGTVVISALNDFPRFWRHPENTRPYPPDAILRLAGERRDAVSPMYEFGEPLRQKAIKLWRPALVDLDFSSTPTLTRVSAILSALQIIVGIRKFWSYDSYSAAYQRAGSA